ncbi:phosphorothioated DNA-binding restriction endonuclease [Streptomyces cacaoi]|uniref:Endonuclease n=2 Tax=Streptomyces cacaoi TaxID=1898 RepID=A0A4Y3QWA1_STRCI|nr:HNH endonuclease [Streptomyces cacaoi]NNG86712.1 restriction endonuclease [Streptomyces cacaoi]GEB48947.1 endonuclease [Streptomyces cacaoi]
MEDWVARVGALRQWGGGGERAPHKPLLLLYALGRYRDDPDGALRYSDVEEDLAGLLREYGPPRRTSAGYPFHHLTGDGVWEVHTDAGPGSPGPNVGELRSRGAAGRLAPGLRAALAERPALLGDLVHTLLHLHFPPSLHADIAADTGLDEVPGQPLAPTAERTGVRRLVRDPRAAAALRRRVLDAYGRRCAFCGFDGALDRRPVGLEAAHVRWWAHRGPDVPANTLCLCALHHRLFDKGVLGVDERARIAVSPRFTARGTAARAQVDALGGRPVAVPEDGSEPVAPQYARWHARQVFRA